jgi:LacI family transcriptional regulator
VDTHTDVLSADSLTSDGVGGGQLVAEHLYTRGHREVMMVAYDTPIYNIEQRITGFSSGLRASGMEVEEDQLVVRVADNVAALEAVLERLGGDAPPTAVFAINDTMASELMDGLAEAGVAVPGDISVVGFDDDPVAAQCVPGLTTVGMEKRDLGAISANMILDRLKNPEKAPSRHVQPTRLVVRDSVATR